MENSLFESASFLDDVSALGNTLACISAVGYGETQIRKRLGLSDLNDLEWRAIPIYREEWLSIRDPLAVAIDLFLLQGTIPLHELNGLCTQSDVETLIRAGLLSVHGPDFVHACVSLFPVGDCLIFSEHAWPMLPHPGLSHVPRHYVMSIGADSRWLARATVRRPVENAIDLCTGSGIQALLAARHSRRVSAVDINPRAVRCTQFNAQVSGITNVNAVVGDLFKPVGEERFDLITANPPFVPSPVDSVCFRDGGRSGEDIQRRIISELPYRLAPGGIAQMITELGERDNDSISMRLQEWLGGAPIDIHILRLREYSPASYSIGHAEGGDYGTFINSVHHWNKNLKDQAYSRIVSVLLAFQWSDSRFGQPWIRSEESEPPRDHHAGIEIEDIFFAERLVRHPDLYQIIEHSRIRRSEKIRIFELGMLGDEGNIRTNAQLIENSISSHQWINPIEREILVRMESTLTLSEMVTLTANLNVGKETLLAALASLIQRRLIFLEDTNYSPI